MDESQQSPDRRVAAVGAMTGGVLMTLGTLLPLQYHVGRTTHNALRYGWGDLVLVLGVSVAMVGVAAFVAASRSRLWLLLGLLSSVALLLVAYELVKMRPSLSTIGAGFPTMAVGAGVGVASSIRGIALQRR
jgi:hypothetical protein